MEDRRKSIVIEHLSKLVIATMEVELMHMWQFWLETKNYSIVYFNCVSQFHHCTWSVELLLKAKFKAVTGDDAPMQFIGTLPLTQWLIVHN